MMVKALQLGEVAELVGGTLKSTLVSETLRITSVNTLKQATNCEVSFLANSNYKADLGTTDAAAVFVSKTVADDVETSAALICVQDPYLAFATLQRYFHPQVKSNGKRHPSACIDESSILADDVEVGAGCVIEAGVSIASGTRIASGCLIGEGVQIGENCLLHMGVKVLHACVLHNRVILQAGAVIGSDGFGYAWTGKEHLKIPQTGRVVLHDDVEIGANTCIDRGVLGDTVIRQGVKLDNLIQIGHNVEIDELTVMASQVGISGSVKVGKGCQIGGQVGTAGHLTLGDGCQLAAKSGVMSDVEAGAVYGGFPAMPHRAWLKTTALIVRLPEMWKKIKKLP